jgi:hypothetical protein
MKRFKWIVTNKTSGSVMIYSSPYGQCSKDSVYHDSEVKEWAGGNPIAIFPCEQ